MKNLLSSFRKHYNILLMAVMLSYAAVIPQLSFAATSTPQAVTNVMCNATNLLTGTTGKTIAIIIVISLAISLFLGKVSWGLAIATLFGMAVLFGAPAVVNTLSGNTTAAC